MLYTVINNHLPPLVSEMNRFRVLKDKEICKIEPINMDEIWFSCPKELSTVSFEVTEFVKNLKIGEMDERTLTIYGKRFEDWTDGSVTEFLVERAKLNAIKKAEKREANEEKARAKIRKDMGWVL
ncbi:hypothetical protein [Testudinibacter sp. TR-2022]|uniref:hypothetical protein n=1 Tax=Testudinibacter sp. TR-2022 TaxID=2585029 RepID=UPI0011190635|nr:hypothetical protein [Testudinibacter sp. TR-2022]TNH04727.1 hypothetical protein FHQ30_11585 [Pasteurellaceae bacterium Phil11]TNH21072.1 hypothetical protein FHQ29_10850 [Testudinibacter sp. TR-2022]TNH22498.1 hypothetical protein FHQ27_12545 [Testudinibacter sp. TR-2022]